MDELLAKSIHFSISQFVFGLIDRLAFEIESHDSIAGSTECVCDAFVEWAVTGVGLAWKLHDGGERPRALCVHEGDAACEKSEVKASKAEVARNQVAQLVEDFRIAGQ